jgi:hypothetical protein
MNEPGDRFEQEAEKIADAVMSKGYQETGQGTNKPQAQFRSGGESEDGNYDENERVGGETATLASKAGILQRQADAGTAPAPTAPAPTAPTAKPATLTYSTKKARTSSGCGGYEYAVTWGLNGASASTNGFIVQKLTFDLKREICAGGKNDFAKTYWEAWQVRGGKIFIGTSTSAHVADTFQVGPTIDQKGVNLEEGFAKYIEGYTEPSTWGNVPEALSLPSTSTKPTGWSDTGATHRSVKCTFNCCDKSDKGTLEGDG